MLRVLVVDDDRDVRESLCEALLEAGHEVLSAVDGAAGLTKLGEGSFDVVVSDLRMPKLDGRALLRAVRRTYPGTDVILMTSFGEVSDAVQALKEGAHDYLTKPFDTDELVVRLATIAETRGLRRDLADARAKLAAGESPLVGASAPMVRLLDRLTTIAASDAPVLIAGESGTGKELCAKRIHAESPRKNGPFVAVNCAAFPETLLESELFGHERGAFTGAVKRREGRFRAANGGTLLLDEVGEMPASLQAKLLRVLEEGMVEPLGSDTPVRVDVRILSATHRDLRQRILEGTFREDLFYRLNVVSLHLPSLRDRRGDLPLLVSHFLHRFSPAGAPAPEVTIEAWRALSLYPFPGNVRELSHAIQHAVVLARGGKVEAHHLPEDILRSTSPAAPSRGVRPLAAALKECEREQLLGALAAAGGKRSRAAELLGISRKNLWEKLRAQGISDSDVEE